MTDGSRCPRSSKCQSDNRDCSFPVAAIRQVEKARDTVLYASSYTPVNVSSSGISSSDTEPESDKLKPECKKALRRCFLLYIFCNLASFLRLASSDSIAEFISCGGQESCIMLLHYAYWKFHRAVKKLLFLVAIDKRQLR